ncbi:hypothetical protein Aca07nite_72280 [Actinoplanes capillaceus]|uniref:Replication-relaxation n=1 Tax=Actinoplanes campanulatus TaxID=113559 RepID=A0ABQ3WUW5_9ACTN|nr:replication-relaxation family protein [Actinoplanes capillaceus]GID49953.1 hypothetical protein Aca07nite_72280 [Actinoplanes capillaceus]
MPLSRTTSLLAIYPHITSRDRQLMQLLDDHQVLTTGQIHRALFRCTRRTCQVRLTELAALGLLERFRFVRDGGGTQPWHWTLGHHGQRFQAAAHHRPEPTPRAARQTIERLSANPRLNHLVLTNEFFIQLTVHALRHPPARLERWWSETEAVRQFRTVTPDGHGLWRVGDAEVGFFLEADTGSEPLGRLVAKLDSYAQLGQESGVRYPVLFWLGAELREDHLQRRLRAMPGTALVATTTHDRDPAERVWLPGGAVDRVRLIELPSDHGKPIAANPNFGDKGAFLP